jgi:hemolysin D
VVIAIALSTIAHDAIPQIEADKREENPIHPSAPAMFGGAQRTQNLVFAVTLKLDTTAVKVDGAPVALTPGMAVTVETKNRRSAHPELHLLPFGRHHFNSDEGAVSE